MLFIRSDLDFSSVREQDSGYYYCVATNDYSSSDSESAYLDVLPRMQANDFCILYYDIWCKLLICTHIVAG